MQNFVVDNVAELQRAETGITGEQQQQEKDACEILVGGHRYAYFFALHQKRPAISSHTPAKGSRILMAAVVVVVFYPVVFVLGGASEELQVLQTQLPCG